jgi:V8-like Glu-specific endopeptidase
LNFTIGETEIGLEANNQSGEVTQERGEFTYGHNITIHRGASGSPVFNAYGEFAGVIVSGFLGVSQGYNHAVQPRKAVELMK